MPDLGVSGRPYKWDDKIMLLELEPGTLLSQSYRVASFILEFMCASLAVDEDRVFEPLRQKMNDFFRLSEEDNMRLEAQKPLCMPTQYGPEYYGDFLCSWLSEGERKCVKNLVIHAADVIPEFADNPEVNSVLCEVLKLREDEEESQEEALKSLSVRGNEVLNLMTLLFKNN